VSASRQATESLPVSPADARLSMADLRACGVTLQWYEAVAIVQGICSAINDSNGPVTNTELTLGQVFLDPEGTISLGARPDPDGAHPQGRKLIVETLSSS